MTSDLNSSTTNHSAESDDERVVAIVSLLKEHDLWEPLKEREREIHSRPYDPLEKRGPDPVMGNINRLVHEKFPLLGHHQFSLIGQVRSIVVNEIFPKNEL